MTFWDFVNGNQTKILGVSSALISTTSGLIAAGAFANLMSVVAIGWTGILCALIGAALGVTTVGVGFSNSTKIKVAEAQAEVATRMETAILTPPPISTGETKV